MEQKWKHQVKIVYEGKIENLNYVVNGELESLYKEANKVVSVDLYFMDGWYVAKIHYRVLMN